MNEEQAEQAYRRIAGALAAAGFAWVVAELEQPALTDEGDAPPETWVARLSELLEAVRGALVGPSELISAIRGGVGELHGLPEVNWDFQGERIPLQAMWPTDLDALVAALNAVEKAVANGFTR